MIHVRSHIAPIGERRGLAAHRAVAVDKLPDDTLLDQKAPAGLGDAHPRIADGEAMAGDDIDQPMPLLAIDRLGREGSPVISSQSYSKAVCAARLA